MRYNTEDVNPFALPGGAEPESSLEVPARDLSEVDELAVRRLARVNADQLSNEPPW